MTEDELKLWERYEAMRNELILFYEDLAELIAKRIVRSATWANWEDLKHEGIIGLRQAIARFDPNKGVPFRAFAKKYIRGAIYDSSELTRDLGRQQHETCLSIRLAEEELTKTLQRNPAIEEVAEHTGLTIEQIHNAIDAMAIAFAGALSDNEDWTSASSDQTAEQERAARIYETLSDFSEREREIMGLYYLRDLQDKDVAAELGLSVSNARKIRQRAIEKLREQLNIKKAGEHDEE